MLPPTPPANLHKQRDEVVDIVKGIGILSVVALHCYLPFLYGINMPLFFLVAGFFAPSLHQQGFVDGLKRRTVNLLRPTFLYIILFGFITYLTSRLPETTIPKKTALFTYLTPEKLFYDTMTFSPGVPYATPLWFVPALWAGFVLWFAFRPFIESCEYSNYRKIILVALLLILYYGAINAGSYNATTPNRLLGFLGRSIYAFCFICFGYLIYQYRQFILYGKGKWILLALAIGSLYWKIRFFDEPPYYIDVRRMYFAEKIRGRSILISFCGIALIFLIARYLEKLKFLKKTFIYIGEKSFHIMALHFLWIWIFLWLMKIPNYYNLDKTSLIFRWLCFLFSITITLGIIALYDLFIPKILARWQIKEENSAG